MKLKLYLFYLLNENLFLKITTSFILILTLGACQKRRHIMEYYKNRKVKSEYYLIADSILDGKKIQYFPSGNVATVEIYSNGEEVDSTIVYEDNSNSTLDQVVFPLINNRQYFKGYDTLGNLYQVGYFDSLDRRVGFWTFYKKDGSMDYQKEFRIIQGQSIVNQQWDLLPSGDTLNTGSSMKYKVSTNRLNLGDSIRFWFQSDVAAISDTDSDYSVIIPSNFHEQNFNRDFSNFHYSDSTPKTSEKYSLLYDSIHLKDKRTIPDSLHRKTVIFYLTPSQIGKDTIRGMFIEQRRSNTDSNIHNIHSLNMNLKKIDTLEYLTRTIYFDIPIEVVE